MANSNFYVKASSLDDFQLKIIRSKSDSPLIVEGCAGSGKSLIAFWKLFEIMKNRKGTAQIIVYTKALMYYFLEGCRAMGIDASFVDYWYRWARNPKTTDYVIVDEVQDFSGPALEFIRAHANKVLLLFGDSSQQLYQTFVDDDLPCLSIEGIRRTTEFPVDRLVFNYRMPARIARVAEYVGGDEELSERCKNEGSESPYFLKLPSFEDQVYEIARIIKIKGCENVGVLLPNKQAVKDMAASLRQKGLSVECRYWIDRSDNEDSLNFATDNVKVITYHSAKGLQFDTVFLPGCEEEIVGNLRKPLYVAMTRPYTSLYVLYTNNLPKVLQNIDPALYNTTVRVRETELL